MMVSRVPTFSIKRIKVPPDQVVPVLVGAMLVVVFLVTEPWATLSFLGLAYLLSLPASVWVARRMREREEMERRVACAASQAEDHPPSPSTPSASPDIEASPAAPSGEDGRSARILRLERGRGGE